jgi:hypothetical protein
MCRHISRTLDYVVKGLHTICFFQQDDGDAGDDDVSSDDNTDILSSL